MIVQLASSGAFPRAPKRPRRTGQQVYRYHSRSVNVLLRESLGLYRVKSGVRKCRPLSQLLLEPQETRGSMGSPDKPVPGILLNAALGSGANPQVQKTQDSWSEAPSPARVEDQEKPSSYAIGIGGHGPHYLLHNSTAFPVDLSKTKFFCS